MKFSIASYSFHRAVRDGKQDMFGYIADSKNMGMAQLDPWNGHLGPVLAEDAQLRREGNTRREVFSKPTLDYLARVKAAADEAGLPVGCLAVDGAHIYEASGDVFKANRVAAYRWIDAAARLGAKQIRIDTGGPEDMGGSVFPTVVAGYNDLIPRAKARGLEVLVENHWGPTKYPANVVKLLETVNDLGLLFDTNNFVPEEREQGWEMTAKYARSVHIKTFAFDANGNEAEQDLGKAIRLLVEAGYEGVWGIESVPRDGDEYGAVEKTKAFIERELAAK